MRSRCLPALLALVAALGVAGAAVPARVAARERSAEVSGADREAARAELEVLARRIEALKKEIAAGRAGPGQLEPLLSRAQELAAEVDRGQARPAVPPPVAAVPDAQELHERADAMRDRADRLDATREQLERRIAGERRRTDLQDRLQAVGASGDMLAETAPRGAQGAGPGAGSTPAVGGAAGAVGGPTTATNQPSSNAPAPSGGTASEPTVVPDPAARAITSPPLRDPEALLRDDAASLQDLLRSRARLQREAGALRAGAEALDADARAAEKVR